MRQRPTPKFRLSLLQPTQLFKSSGFESVKPLSLAASFCPRTDLPYDILKPDRDVAQLGSAVALGAIGRRFESCRPDSFHYTAEICTQYTCLMEQRYTIGCDRCRHNPTISSRGIFAEPAELSYCLGFAQLRFSRLPTIEKNRFDSFINVFLDVLDFIGARPEVSFDISLVEELAFVDEAVSC